MKVDGNDVEATFEVTRQARERALAGDGPTMIEAVTMRMHGHAAHDDMKYVPKEKVEEWQAKDPIDLQVRRAEAAGVDVAALRDEVKARDRRRRRARAGEPDARRRDGHRPPVRRRACAARGRPRAVERLRRPPQTGG